jgi:hypothetical protein
MRVYLDWTIQVYKDNVFLFETDCELSIEYEQFHDDLPNWDVVEFHYTDKYKETGRPIYTKVCRYMPLFHVLYNALDLDKITDALVRELDCYA